MALISCPECGYKVSFHAVACPSCGYPNFGLREKARARRVGCAWVIVGLVVLLLIGALAAAYNHFEPGLRGRIGTFGDVGVNEYADMAAS